MHCCVISMLVCVTWLSLFFSFCLCIHFIYKMNVCACVCKIVGNFHKRRMICTGKSDFDCNFVAAKIFCTVSVLPCNSLPRFNFGKLCISHLTFRFSFVCFFLFHFLFGLVEVVVVVGDASLAILFGWYCCIVSNSALPVNRFQCKSMRKRDLYSIIAEALSVVWQRQAKTAYTKSRWENSAS